MMLHTASEWMIEYTLLAVLRIKANGQQMFVVNDLRILYLVNDFKFMK